MPRQDRKALIQQIEEARSSRVLVYVTGDRAPATAQIGDDAVRPMYSHLREMGHIRKLDLFIYSRGGAIDVPWRIVTALRQTSDQWNILVPFRANSAATLVALGADAIVLGRQGELGPIDPIMTIQRMVPQPGGGEALVQEQMSVEDIMAYTKFIHERAGLSDQEALSTALTKLTDRLDAVGLGNVYRTHLHIRDVALRMLQSHKKPVSERTMAAIIETLAERVYAHGHAIGLTEAKAIGLPVEAANDDLDDLMWKLLNQYENDMKLLQPLDPVTALGTSDLYTEDSVIAMIESSWAVHGHAGKIEVRARRQPTPNLNVALNLNIQLPPNLSPQQQAALQQLLQASQQQIIQQAQEAVQQALREQTPLIGVDAAFRGGHWEKSD
jgi:Serine dehydrogenase proteinase